MTTKFRPPTALPYYCDDNARQVELQDLAPLPRCRHLISTNLSVRRSTVPTTSIGFSGDGKTNQVRRGCSVSP